MSELVKAQASVLEKLALEEVDLLKNEICKGATDNELVHFLKVCSSLNLNPFTKQIYSLPFSGGRVVVIGIDGLSTIAHRTNEYVGCGPATFEFKNPNDKQPLSAEVTVYRMRNGVKGEFTAKVFMDEYKPKFKSTMWDKFPKRMLEKCAHALALKKGFNEEMTGLYTTEEMDQAKDDKEPQGKIIDLETLAKKEKEKEKPFDSTQFRNLLISYCEVKLQESVANPIHTILDHLNVEIKSHEENKQYILNLDEKAKKDLTNWLENQLR
jgi:phage recombination protein Bet